MTGILVGNPPIRLDGGNALPGNNQGYPGGSIYVLQTDPSGTPRPYENNGTDAAVNWVANNVTMRGAGNPNVLVVTGNAGDHWIDTLTGDAYTQTTIPSGSSWTDLEATAMDQMANFAATTAVVTAGVWQHVCGVEAAINDRRVYLDGGNKGTNSTSWQPGVQSMDATRVGRRFNGPDYFDGGIAHIALWTAALTDGEVASLAAGASPLRIRRDSLLVYWPLNGRDPEPDIIGGVALTVNGAVTFPEPPIPQAIKAP